MIVQVLIYILVRMGTTRSQELPMIKNTSVEFVCIEGTTIPIANVCDGWPNCPDSSDEIGKLCRRVLCPQSMYRCSYGACVTRDARCNGLQDCVDGSDETHCDQDPYKICSDREFQCANNTFQFQCIPLSDVCNGYLDCPDGSDEDAGICAEYSCPENSYRCSYGGCVHEEVVCDTIKDCVDATDEDTNACASINCIGSECTSYTCRENEFTCENKGGCIPKDQVCDGIRQCKDTSDENPEICQIRECPQGWFRCSYGACVRSELVCNLRADCYDWSDEDQELCGTPLPQGACRLPGPRPGTHYKVVGCAKCRPGDTVPELTRLDYACDLENSLEGSDNIYCQNNKWIPYVPVCLNVTRFTQKGEEMIDRTIHLSESQQITCPAITTAFGAIKECEARWGLNKGWVRYDRSIPVGTRCTFECPNFYERSTGATSTTCLHDGVWSQRPLSCQPICGIRESSAAALIVRGWNVAYDTALPWHVTLFSHENGKWKFFCGGTLIAERVVLTAGHCVWRSSIDTIHVALGVFSSDLKDAGEQSQILGVDRIEIETSYQDHEGNYGSDLALLILKQAVNVSDFVRPVCIDWESDFTLVAARLNGDFGLVPGMGLTENDTYSPNLRVTSVRIVSDEECRDKQKSDFRKYLTYTSFCAGWANGTGVCNGDSGGGLVLKRPNSSIWELHGVVSISPRRLGTSFCDPSFFTVFTKVSLYGRWIRRVVENIPVSGPSDVNWQPNRDDIVI